MFGENNKKQRNWRILYCTTVGELRRSELCTSYEAFTRMKLDKGTLFIEKIKGWFKRRIFNKNFILS